MFDEMPNRLRGGNQVNVVRLDDTKVAVVFHLATAEDADHLEASTLEGLRRGEFKMRLRGKPAGEEVTPAGRSALSQKEGEGC